MQASSIVGASHTTKNVSLARHGGVTEYITLPSQPLSSDVLANLEEKISILGLVEGDILYLVLFTNSIYTWEATRMGYLSLRIKTLQVYNI